MHPLSIITSIALVSLVGAVKLRGLPLNAPVAARAVTGPEYECHADCGYTILNGKGEGYCSDPDWLADYNGCLKCANLYGLWPDYGDGVKAAAQSCGLSAVPSPAGSSSPNSSESPTSQPTSPIKAVTSDSIVTSNTSAASTDTSVAGSSSTDAATSVSATSTVVGGGGATQSTTSPTLDSSASSSTSVTTSSQEPTAAPTSVPTADAPIPITSPTLMICGFVMLLLSFGY